MEQVKQGNSSVIVGRCEHGVAVAFALEGKHGASADFMDEMACGFRLERVFGSVSVGGVCGLCKERIDANRRLLNSPEATVPPMKGTQ